MIDIKKAKEALREVCQSSHCVSETLRKDLKPFEVTERKSIVFEAINELERLQRKPTAEEVRKAIEDEIDWDIKIDDNEFVFKNGGYVVEYRNGKIVFNFSPSPKLAIMIAKFFEVE
jgi:hypothetical protein